ncbi:MAG: four helix bundle protein [Armatimonadetes bacterium]|nr:four helix bundle protein [Armatimonadota bacterium]
MNKAESHRDLEVFKRAVVVAMRVFELSKTFPRQEAFSLTDQIRRSSRSVAANITEAWRERRYEAAFISKLSDAETEAAETQTWLEFAVKCGYLEKATAKELFNEYEELIRMIVSMIHNTEKWCLPK